MGKINAYDKIVIYNQKQENAAIKEMFT